jgi:short chain dehydrogenase
MALSVRTAQLLAADAIEATRVRCYSGRECARKEFEELGGRALVLPSDVADPATTEDAAAGTEAEFGSIDVWVNDAMTTVFWHISDMPPDDCKRVTDVTCLGFVYGTLTTLRRMPPRDRGTIVQVGLALAYRSVLLQSAYCVAKNALVGFTDSLRSELIHDRSQCSRDGCAHASRQYTAVQLVQVAHALQGATGAADIPAGGVRGGGVLGCPPAPSRSLRRLATARAIWASASCPAFLDRVAAKLAWDGLF